MGILLDIFLSWMPGSATRFLFVKIFMREHGASDGEDYRFLYTGYFYGDRLLECAAYTGIIFHPDLVRFSPRYGAHGLDRGRATAGSQGRLDDYGAITDIRKGKFM